MIQRSAGGMGITVWYASSPLQIQQAWDPPPRHVCCLTVSRATDSTESPSGVHAGGESGAQGYWQRGPSLSQTAEGNSPVLFWLQGLPLRWPSCHESEHDGRRRYFGTLSQSHSPTRNTPLGVFSTIGAKPWGTPSVSGLYSNWVSVKCLESKLCRTVLPHRSILLCLFGIDLMQ